MSVYQTSDTNGWVPPQLALLQQKGIKAICFNADTFVLKETPEGGGTISYKILNLTAKLKKPSGAELTFEYDGANNDFQVEIDEEGEYFIRFSLNYQSTSAYGGHSKTFEYKTYRQGYFAVVDEDTFRAYTIKDVIDRVLSVTPTRTAKWKNKYTFRNDAKEYATEESPEFTFTNKHLFEVMLDIASYKKMFPAVHKNEIYFRPFWNGIMLTSDDLPEPTKAVLNSAIDQYCTALDSYVENMVCINDTAVGTVVEPYAGGYVSARSNGGSEISETTAVIPTQSGIYQPIVLNVGETDGVTVGDIQSYVYEQEDYEALSDTSAAYPYSKGYALKYTRFEKNYTELAHRIKASNTISSALKNPALSNIIDKHTNGAVGSTGVTLKDYIRSFLDSEYNATKAAPFAELLFQPNYIPVVNARVRQYKPMYSENDYEATLFYNQQSEVVDSEAFGEHVKGLVQKLGNHTEIRVYRFDKIDDVPTVGTLIDEKSVYDVAMTIYENHVDATICLVDYAELSTYIGVKNEIKTSDISTTKWCNRFINWEEYLLFTHEAKMGNSVTITNEALVDIVSFTASEPLTCAVFTTYTDDGAEINTAFAPIKHLALGNSIYFQWEMLDNFAVGYKSEPAPEDARSAWTGTQYDRAQRAVRYCDSLGQAETLDFQLLKTGPTSDNSRFVAPAVYVDRGDGNITIRMEKASDLYINWRVVMGIETDDGYSETVVDVTVPPGYTKSSIKDVEQIKKLVVSASVLNSKMEHKAAIIRMIAHSYPQKPSNLVFKRKEMKPAFKMYDMLIKKNSAEALKFAAQYHFRQDWSEFIIGSGMSNFCSLVGGSCAGLVLFVSAYPINRFERHVDMGKELTELPTFTLESGLERMKITLPQTINDETFNRSWGLAGRDRNGNYQLIFGENKKANEQFQTTIYLVPRAKNKGEPRASSLYVLTRTQSYSSVGCWIYVDNELIGDIGYNSWEIARNSVVRIYNSQASSVSLILDGQKIPLGYKGSYINVYIPYTEKELERQYALLVERYIRQKYSLSAELAILRQRDTKPEEFAEYNAYAEQCKAKAKEILGQ